MPDRSQESAAGIALLHGVQLDADEPITAQVYEIIRQHIVSVQFLPGLRLSETEIARVLGSSKTPVREALIRLEAIGLVNIVSRSGSYVTPISIERYVEACFVRLNLEVGAVRRAATAQNHRQIGDEMREILAEQSAAVDASDYPTLFKLDQKLHQSFFRLSGIGGVWDTVTRSQADVDRVRHLKRIHNIRRGAEVVCQHRVIVEAIRDGDPDAAVAALLAHIGSLEVEIDDLRRHPALLNFIETVNNPGGTPIAGRALDAITGEGN